MTLVERTSIIDGKNLNNDYDFSLDWVRLYTKGGIYFKDLDQKVEFQITQRLTVSSVSGAPTIWDTITWGTSTDSWIIVWFWANYVDIKSPTWSFFVTETLTSPGYSSVLDLVSSDITVQGWEAKLLCIRTASTPIPNQEVMVNFEMNEPKILDVTWDKKIFIEIDDAQLQDPTLVTQCDWTLIWSVKSESAYPTTSCYIPLREITAWAWQTATDVREALKIQWPWLQLNNYGWNILANDITFTGTLTGSLSGIIPFVFGDGTDWDLIVAAWTTNIALDTVWNFSSVNIAAWATLSSGAIWGSMLIKCDGLTTIDWDIDLTSLGNDSDMLLWFIGRNLAGWVKWPGWNWGQWWDWADLNPFFGWAWGLWSILWYGGWWGGWWANFWIGPAQVVGWAWGNWWTPGWLWGAWSVNWAPLPAAAWWLSAWGWGYAIWWAGNTGGTWWNAYGNPGTTWFWPSNSGWGWAGGWDTWLSWANITIQSVDFAWTWSIITSGTNGTAWWNWWNWVFNAPWWGWGWGWGWGWWAGGWAWAYWLVWFTNLFTWSIINTPWLGWLWGSGWSVAWNGSNGSSWINGTNWIAWDTLSSLLKDLI